MRQYNVALIGEYWIGDTPILRTRISPSVFTCLRFGMSVLFWVIVCTMALVTSFVVARPLLGKETRQATPAIFIALLVPLLAVGIYTKLGTPGVAAHDSGKPPNSMNSPGAVAPTPKRGLGSVASLVDLLAERLERETDDAEGWILLARSYEHLGRLEKARQAYDKAVALGKADADLASKLSNEPTPGASDVKIQGRIALADEAQARVLPADTIFVFAKGIGGPPMPVAVIQKSAAELPFEFALSDDHSIMRGVSLSNFEEVVVGARVSRTGDATGSVSGLHVQEIPIVVGDGGFIELRIKSNGSAE